MTKGKEHWIAGAIKHPGAFKAKAAKAGESTSAYAHNVLADDSQATAKTKKQAQLALTLAAMHKKK